MLYSTRRRSSVHALYHRRVLENSPQYNTYHILYCTLLSFLLHPWRFVCLLGSIYSGAISLPSRLQGSIPPCITHNPLTLPHYYTVLTFLAWSNRFLSTALHRTSLIARSSKLPCALSVIGRNTETPSLTSLASWYEYSTLSLRRGRQATYFPSSALPAAIPSRLPPETRPPLVFLPSSLPYSFAFSDTDLP